jgi:hypothetical protein
MVQTIGNDARGWVAAAGVGCSSRHCVAARFRYKLVHVHVDTCMLG